MHMQCMIPLQMLDTLYDMAAHARDGNLDMRSTVLLAHNDCVFFVHQL